MSRPGIRTVFGASLGACLGACLGASGAIAQQSSPTRRAAATSEWTLVWHDEFDGAAGGSVDARGWTFDRGDGCADSNCGWGNEEKQSYTSDRANAALTGDGKLAITARRSTSDASCYYGPCRYTSAKLKTKGKVSVRFGRVEARIRLPTGQGLWPAFWMLGDGFPSVGWPDCGELDIMEHHGSQPGNVSSAMHGPGYSGGDAIVHAYAPEGANFTAGFHRYAVEWDSTAVRFFVDDDPHVVVTRREVEARGAWSFDHPFYVILNLAVGGTFDGDPTSDAVLPATMLVDYVRVFARAP
jgi:beta-glucanase (GH16 family)